MESTNGQYDGCCRVPYILQLLREGLGLQESQIEIGRGNEGWSLGAALSEGSKALSASSEPLVTAQRIGGELFVCYPIS